MELCQLNKLYVHSLVQYNKVLLQRNKLLKELFFRPEYEETLDVWDMQLVDRINFGDGCVRYEIGHLLNGETKHNHHHLICKRCNKVMPFDDDLLESLEDHIEKATGFHVLDHELKFYGLCKDCMKKQR